MKTPKHVFVSLGLLIAMTLSAHAQMESRLNPTSISPNAEANISIVDRYVEAIFTEDYATMRSMVTDNYISLDNTEVGDTATIDDVIAAWKENHKVNADHTLQGFHSALMVDEGPQKGDWILFWGWAGWNNEVMNKQMGMPIHLVFQIQDGKIAVDAAYYDSRGILEEMGFAIVPPEE